MKFFDIKALKGLTLGQANSLRKEHESKLTKEEKRYLNEWKYYENIFEEIEESGIREDYDMKKVSIALYRKAITKLVNEGHTLEALMDDIEDVVDKIIELKPDIVKK